MAEEIKSEREILKEKADLMGISYASNISTDKLKELVNDKLGEPVKVEDKQDATAEDPIQAQRLHLTKKIRVMISCNDPAMKEYDMTPYYSFSNSVLTLDRITIPLNVEWHIPQAYVDMLSAMECKITVPSKDEKGRKIKIRKTIKKYNVNILPPLTEKELEELKQAQLMRDGIK